MNRLVFFSVMIILASMCVEASARKVTGTVSPKLPGTKILKMTVAECHKNFGGVVLSTTCRSGGACRLTTVDGDGQIVYRDECLTVQ